MIRVPIRNYCTGSTNAPRFCDLLLDENDDFRPYLEQKIGKRVYQTMALEDIQSQVASAIREAKRKSA